MDNSEISNVKFVFLKRFATSIVGGALILVLPATASAYVGPGAGLSIIGSLLAFLAAIVIGIFGFLWFPIRRILRKRKQAAEQKAEQVASDESPAESVGGEVGQGESDA